MKNLVLVGLCIFNSFFLKAKDWELFEQNTFYHYGFQGLDSLETTVYIDSVAIKEDDTLFYFNRTATTCYECDYMVNLPSLFGYTAKKHLGEYKLNLLDSIKNDYQISWDIQQDSGVNAVLDSVYLISIFERTDSVKQISISNGDYFLLSKSFGIVEYYNLDLDSVYELIGVDFGGQSFGYRSLTVSSVFDYSVGDELHYFNYEYEYDEDVLVGWYTFPEIHTVVDKDILGDSVKYVFYIQGYEDKNNERYSFYDTLVYHNNFENNKIFQKTYLKHDFVDMDNFYSILNTEGDISEQIYNYIGYQEDLDSHLIQMSPIEFEPYYYFMKSYIVEYEKGFGITYSIKDPFVKELIGYKKDSVELIIYDYLDYVLPVDSIDSSTSFEVNYLLSQKLVKIDASKDAIVVFSNINGLILFQEELSLGTNTFDMSLQKGFFIVSIIHQDEIVYSEKMIFLD